MRNVIIVPVALMYNPLGSTNVDYDGVSQCAS